MAGFAIRVLRARIIELRPVYLPPPFDAARLAPPPVVVLPRTGTLLQHVAHRSGGMAASVRQVCSGAFAACLTAGSWT